MNSLGAPGGQDGIALSQGDPGFLSTRGSEKGLETLGERAASPVIVLHCLVLDLLADTCQHVVILHVCQQN